MTKKVAVIGYAYRFPGSPNSTYWESLLRGQDLITEVDASRWAQPSFLHPDKSHLGTSYTFAAGSIGDIASFDADFFGISPREAALMDPQQRLLLELGWEALEHAGVPPSSLRGSNCGVFMGIASADYFYRLMDDLASIDASVATGNTSSIAANRLSYFFDLHGPSVAIDTACSSSLIAFHQACQSILCGETTHALTGGVSLHIHPAGFISFSKASMLSRQGRCNVFDADADGYVRSEGGGILYLKDFDAAVADGNRILAVVASTAVNTDGRKSGLTVPSVNAQAALLTAVYAKAGIQPDDIHYIEAHGTGTAVGDPIETRALGEALGTKRSSGKPLLIGSVKSNIGHLEAASGVAGLIKSLLCIQHRTVPATIGIRKLNPNIKFSEWNLKVASATTALPKTGKLIIGTNSFGFGGANAHVILESYENPEAKIPRPAIIPEVPVVVTAKNAAGLNAAIEKLIGHLRSHAHLPIYDVAYTSRYFRDWHSHRAIVFGNTTEVIAERFSHYLEGNKSSTKLSLVNSSIAIDKPIGPAFVFSGNGSQWATMGKTLLAKDVHFRNAVREVDAIFKTMAHFSLEAELNGLNAGIDETAGSSPDSTVGNTTGRSTGNSNEDRFARTEIAQPALFALQVGLCAMLKHRGITPVAVAGHSVGEVAAAWASGALTLEAAVKVIYERSRLQGTTRGVGQMTAVSLNAKDAQLMIDQLGFGLNIVISGFNSPQGLSLAGDVESLTLFENHLAASRVAFKRLDIDYAFHSPAMDGIELAIEQSLATIKARETTIPLYSTVTGDVIDGRELHANYWWYNIRQPVQFAPAIASMLSHGINIFIEISPHAILGSYIKDCIEEAGTTGIVIPTLMRGNDDPQRVWSAASLTILSGATVDWAMLLPWRGRFAQLPTYAWQKERHWAEPGTESRGLLTREWIHPLLGYALPHQHPDYVWESVIDTRRAPNYLDHVVGGATVFPGSAFAEIAAAAAFAYAFALEAADSGSTEHYKTGDQSARHELVEIESLEIRTPLTLSAEHSTVLQTRLDVADGSLGIYARELGATAFVLHATARIVPHPNTKLLAALAVGAPLTHAPQRAPDFDAARHRQLTQNVGLEYGPAFAAVSMGWREGNTAFAQFSVPLSIDDELAQHHLHPALLDCTFQLIIELLVEHAELSPGSTFVPVRMERFAITGLTTRPATARATLLRHSRQSVTAEFEILDADSNLLATFKEVRFQSMRLQKANVDHLRYLDYKLVAQPHPAYLSHESKSAPVQTGELAERLRIIAQQPVSNLLFTTEIEPLLDATCVAFMRDSLSLLTDARGEIASHIVNAQHFTASQRNVLRSLFRGAIECGLLEPTAMGWLVIESDKADAAEASAQDIWNCLLADYPDYFDAAKAVGRVGLQMLDACSGQPVADLAIQTGLSNKTIMEYNLGRSGIKLIGDELVNLLVDAIQRVPAGERLSIVDMGGELLLTERLCTALNFAVCDYRLVLDNNSAIDDAERLQTRFPEVELDIECAADFESSASPARSANHASISSRPARALADLVILTLGTCTAQNRDRIFADARRRLTPHGALIVLGRNPSSWSAFVASANHDADMDAAGLDFRAGINTADIAVDAATASLIAGRHGLDNISVHALSGTEGIGPYLLLATAANIVPDTELTGSAVQAVPLQQTVVVVTDAGSTFNQIVTHQLSNLGFSVATTHASTVSELKLFFAAAASEAASGTLHAIVHLAGLAFSNAERKEDLEGNSNNNDDDEGERESEGMLANISRRAMLTSAITEALEIAHATTTLWVAVQGGSMGIAAAESMLNSAPSENPNAAGINDTALWGWVRTLMNETASPIIKLVDLGRPDTGANPRAIQSFCREICWPTDESEIVFDASGARFVSRLVALPAPSTSTSLTIDPADHAAPAFCLGFVHPGQLKSLQWERRELRVLGPNDVEVDIRATGLNFRDVMYALGILTDAAMENGFAGATLGLEFAGVVTSVGAEVAQFAPGDCVLGFGSACLGNRVVTDARGIALLPAGASFEAGATIPSTFFTAYYAFVKLARLSKGEKVLIHGAAGGVGLAAVQVAHALGAEVYATVGSSEKREVLRLIGVKHIYDSRSLAFADEILRDTDNVGVDVVLNSLAGEAVNRNFRVLKPFGRFIELGKRDFFENTKIGLRPFRNNISYFGVDADQLMREHPALTASLFSEIMALFANGTLNPLPYRAFEANHVVDAFRYMQQAKQIGKIVVTYPNPIFGIVDYTLTKQPSLALTANASYLVTGGLSGFGLKTAEWLARKGARSLVLINRSGIATDEARQGVELIRSLGATVTTFVCDVSNRTAVNAMLMQVATSLPPLKGIVHAAMVIDDGLIRTTTQSQMQRVLAPKILGALNLHALTLSHGIELDMFVLYSSATTLFGNPGQGSYIAANSWLEALAASRRAAGLNATAVRWGAIADAGFLARNTGIRDALQNRMGGHALTCEVALNALEQLLLNDQSGIGVLEFEWRALSKFLPTASSPKFAALAKSASDTSLNDTHELDLRRMVTELSHEELMSLFTSIVQAEVAEILRIATEKIDPKRSMFEMGLDSLMGVELATALEARFGVRLPVMVLAESPTITKLAARLITQLHGESNPAAIADTVLLSQAHAVAAQHGAEISAEFLAEFAHEQANDAIGKQQRMIV